MQGISSSWAKPARLDFNDRNNLHWLCLPPPSATIPSTARGAAPPLRSTRHADLLYEQATHAGVNATLARYPGDHNALVQTNHDAQNELIQFFKAHLGTQSE